MEKDKKRKVILFILLIIIAAFGIYYFLSSQPPSSKKVSQIPAKTTQQLEIKKPEKIEFSSKTQSYDLFSLRDPFYPQIVRKDILKNTSPLENYEIEELKLSGIIRDNKIYKALIKTPDGRHFVVKEKDKIGIHKGIITKISNDKIEIREAIRSHTGEIIQITKTLKLRTEEGL